VRHWYPISSRSSPVRLAGTAASGHCLSKHKWEPHTLNAFGLCWTAPAHWNDGPGPPSGWRRSIPNEKAGKSAGQTIGDVLASAPSPSLLVVGGKGRARWSPATGRDPARSDSPMNSLPQLTHEPQLSPTSRRVPRPFAGWSRSACSSRNWRSDLVQLNARDDDQVVQHGRAAKSNYKRDIVKVVATPKQQRHDKR
jgi:hypothetical protein